MPTPCVIYPFQTVDGKEWLQEQAVGMLIVLIRQLSISRPNSTLPFATLFNIGRHISIDDTV